MTVPSGFTFIRETDSFDSFSVVLFSMMEITSCSERAMSDECGSTSLRTFA